MNVALLSHVLPGAPSGQGVMLGRLLPGFPEPPLVIASPRAAERGAAWPGGQADAHDTPPPKGVRPAPAVAYLAADVPARAGNALLPLAVMRRAGRIAALLRAFRCRALVACSGDLVDLPAGRIAAALAGVSFVAWLFDPYAGQWPGRALNLFASVAERLALAGAAAVLVPNEFARRLYERRYHRPVRIVRNPLPDDYPFAMPAAATPGSIRYTGAVYRVNGFGLDRLADLLDAHRRPCRTLDIYASQDQRYLAALARHPAVRLHPHVDERQALAVQRAADLLYLPLGRRREFPGGGWDGDSPPPGPFDSAGARALLTGTAAPAKLGEYLASGRPLLARVPRRSYIAWYLRRHEAGLVVDTPGRQELGTAVETLLAGGPDVQRMQANAVRRARLDFAPEPARAALRTVLAGIG